ncbi:MAG TPA: CBS domain-containing protein [Acidimicrobiia bacterium]|nr:CBS domain-containing protein [Acidimicrobiia bacterium]
MGQQIAEVMTRNPYGVTTSATLNEAARMMRDQEIGDVLVMRDDGTLCGLVTDRDLVVRGLAEGLDPGSASVEEVCNHDPVTLSSDQPVEEAVAMMRQYNIRRLPIVDGENLVGILSLGDLAIEKDPSSALADISKAPSNN